MTKQVIISSLVLWTLIQKGNAFQDSRCHTAVNFQQLYGKHDVILKQEECTATAKDTCTRFGTIRVAYFEMEPFTKNMVPSVSAPQTSYGIVQDIMRIALTECCGTCAEVKYVLHTSDRNLAGGRAKNESDIQFPIFIQGQSKKKSIIPLIRLSSATFIIKSAVNATKFGFAVFRAIVDIWPLLGLSLLLAYTTGVIMWFVDTWSNKEHFPRNFLQGAFEGFWWSFISMTTVGYGDRSPKSVPAKLFACFWILCGITIVSLLTAALTTAISSVDKQLRPSIQHGSVGILENHLFEKSILLKGNAKIQYRRSIHELIGAINKGDIDGMLVDSYTLKTLGDELLINEGLYIDRIIEESSESHISVVIDDKELHDLINEYVEYRSDTIHEFIQKSVPASISEDYQPRIPANIIFTTQSGIFYPTLVVGIVIIILTITLGITYELYQKKKSKKKVERRSTFNLTPKNLRKLEEQLENELCDTVLKWDKNILQMIDNYSIQGMFSNSNRTYPNVMVRLQTRTCSSSLVIGKGNSVTPATVTKKDNLPTRGNYHKFRNESIAEECIQKEVKMERRSIKGTQVQCTENEKELIVQTETTKTRKKLRQKRPSELNPQRPLPPIKNGNV